jgi:hypothetical protein
MTDQSERAGSTADLLLQRAKRAETEVEQLRADRDRWRHEYRIEKQKNALLRADLRRLASDEDGR